MSTLTANDYQQFEWKDGHVVNIGRRMQQKLDAVGLPDDLDGVRVLDVGCDMGFWSLLCHERGAEKIVGLDRGRHVGGQYVDLAEWNSRNFPECEFHNVDLGEQWHDFGHFDLALMMSMYHHIYAHTGNHETIWYWLRRQLVVGGKVLWEGPFDLLDPVPDRHIPEEFKSGYNPDAIFGAASKWFDVQYIGPALHEENRHVFYLTAKPIRWTLLEGTAIAGAGGATRAWMYEDERRINEFEHKFGMRCIPGSLNVKLDRVAPWEPGWLKVDLLDVADRAKGLGGEWYPRRLAVKPCQVNNAPAYAFRFQGEKYGWDFVELVSKFRLRDFIGPDNHVQVLL
jgi:SAM-dependent methyltransferase